MMTRRLTALLMTGLLLFTALPSGAAGEPVATPLEGTIAQVAHPSTTSSLLSESNTRTQLKLQELLYEHQANQALILADHALETESDNGDLLFLKARALAQLERRSEAITILKNITERFPEMAAPYNNLAALYAASNDLDDARRTLEKAIHAQPNYALAQENLGDVYLALAKAAYARARTLNPNNRALKLKADKLNFNSPKETTHGPS